MAKRQQASTAQKRSRQPKDPTKSCLQRRRNGEKDAPFAPRVLLLLLVSLLLLGRLRPAVGARAGWHHDRNSGAGSHSKLVKIVVVKTGDRSLDASWWMQAGVPPISQVTVCSWATVHRAPAEAPCCARKKLTRQMCAVLQFELHTRIQCRHCRQSDPIVDNPLMAHWA